MDINIRGGILWQRPNKQYITNQSYRLFGGEDHRVFENEIMKKHNSLLKAQKVKDGTKHAISLNPVLGDRYFFVRWDLRILIRNENEKQKFKP